LISGYSACWELGAPSSLACSVKRSRDHVERLELAVQEILVSRGASRTSKIGRGGLILSKGPGGRTESARRHNQAFEIIHLNSCQPLQWHDRDQIIYLLKGNNKGRRQHDLIATGPINRSRARVDDETLRQTCLKDSPGHFTVR